MKNAKNRLNKEVNDLKQQSTLESTAKKAPLVVDDLEKSQASSHQAQSNQ